MSPPVAVVAHDMPGRTRLRIASKRGHRAYFADLERTLADCPVVTKLAVSPLTGSVLVIHGGDLSAVAAFAREHGSFELSLGPGDVRPLSAVDEELRRLDEKLWARSGEKWGLHGVTFYGLVGATLYQMARGHLLPPAGTLLFQAMTIFLKGLQAEQSRGGRPDK